eukprot:CAMPEP_0177302018 /NCGR_PEP_ID=MMETSP0368-20130122/5365_1 /TAXON_ID=447022 ORGANISM="Scrippsiella hangoei-like, Strain SHHI-4" /NCGR_SAMPLE_ID=MMETSP0368 /ASSEMBLY_ACC=CAM_ASM_000363 /LENGTH=240 /DNA_ID=CAMNT_0018760449 /DNA_START=18 /DNA_END=737 /DNA_ORIENTATION=+
MPALQLGLQVLVSEAQAAGGDEGCDQQIQGEGAVARQKAVEGIEDRGELKQEKGFSQVFRVPLLDFRLHELQHREALQKAWGQATSRGDFPGGPWLRELHNLRLGSDQHVRNDVGALCDAAHVHGILLALRHEAASITPHHLCRHVIVELLSGSAKSAEAENEFGIPQARIRHTNQNALALNLELKSEANLALALDGEQANLPGLQGAEGHIGRTGCVRLLRHAEEGSRAVADEDAHRAG